MLVFLGGLGYNSDKISTEPERLTAENYSKHFLGAAKRPPGGISLSLGSHQPDVVEVLSKFRRRPPKKTSIKVTSMLPCIEHRSEGSAGIFKLFTDAEAEALMELAPAEESKHTPSKEELAANLSMTLRTAPHA